MPQTSLISRPARLSAAALLLVFAVPLLHAQDSTSQAPPAPAQPVVGPAAPYPTGPHLSRFDLYGGYGYFHPGSSDINNIQYQPINPGAVVSITGYFTPHLGLQAEGSFFPSGPNDCVYTGQAGPIARFQHGRFVPFVHALGGAAKVGGPAFQPCTWGWGVTGGVGFDYIVKGFNDHLAIRPIQADFEFSQVDYGPLVIPAGVSGGFGQIQAYRLSAGAVLRFGNMNPPPPVALGCSITQNSPFAGEPILISGTATNLNPKRPAIYTFTSTGGAVTQNDSSASIATKGLAAGSYTVTGRVSQGPKAFESATCVNNFTLRNYDPPTLTCSADPASVVSGVPSTITSNGVSPQNRALSYTYTTSGGVINGSGATVSLATAGVAPGTITVNCNVVDDLGQTASAMASVTVTAPPAPPPAPQTVKECSISFARDRKRPNRVDNEAKACLDDLALALNRQADAKLVVTGNHTAAEIDRNAAERAFNVRQYLTIEKRIDPSRIELRTGDAGTQTVDDTLVPAGATMDPGQSQPVDPATVTPKGQPYGKPKAPRR